MIEKMPLTELTEPKDGYVAYVNRWWIVDDEGAYLFVQGTGLRRHVSPQCNLHESIAVAIGKKFYPEARVELVPLAFLPMGNG